MSQFNPDTFLNTEIDEEFETHFTPIPADDYQAIIGDVKPRVTAKGQSILDVYYDLVDVDEIKKNLGVPELRVRQSIFLDINEHGGMEIGGNKNIKLGKLRKAVGQNQSGQPWAPSMLVGAGPVTVMVIEKPDADDPDTIYNEVKRVAGA